MLFSITLISLTALAALALSMNRHARQLGRKPPTAAAKTGLRVLGYLLLGVGVVASAQAWGGVIGVTLYLGLLSLCQPLVAFALTTAERWRLGRRA